MGDCLCRQFCRFNPSALISYIAGLGKAGEGALGMAAVAITHKKIASHFEKGQEGDVVY
jgi:hypothetical protein